MQLSEVSWHALRDPLSAVFLSELRVLLPLNVLPLETPTKSDRAIGGNVLSGASESDQIAIGEPKSVIAIETLRSKLLVALKRCDL